MKNRSGITVGLIILSAALIASCGLLPNADSGTLVLSLSPRLVVQTIEPTVDMNPLYYNIKRMQELHLQ